MGHLLYIDPGTGTLVFQMLMAGIVTFLAFSRKVKAFIIRLFTNLKRKK
jgi:hypothetical protein